MGAVGGGDDRSRRKACLGDRAAATLRRSTASGTSASTRISTPCSSSTWTATWSRASAAGCSSGPHGIDVAPDGSVWVTDGARPAKIPPGSKRGHRVVKFSQTGEVLMVLGTPGRRARGRIVSCRRPTWSVADSGEIFVAGRPCRRGQQPRREVRQERQVHQGVGQDGQRAGRVPHVARDRHGLQRPYLRWRPLQQPYPDLRSEGAFLAECRSSGDRAESSSTPRIEFMSRIRNPTTWRIPGGRWASAWATRARAGSNRSFLYPWSNPQETRGHGAEFVAADSDGNLYAGEPRPRVLRKYVRVRP